MRGLRAIVTWGLLLFVGLVALQHPLRGDLPPGEHFVSEYAKGSTAALQVLAFAAWTVALAAGARLAWIATPLVPRRRVARTLAAFGLALAAAGIALAAVFATQTIAGVLPPGMARTTEGRLHDFGTLLTLAGLLLAAGASLRIVERRGYRVTIGLLFAAMVLSVPLLAALGLDAPGIGQRVFLLVGCAFQWRFDTELGRLSPLLAPASARA